MPSKSDDKIASIKSANSSFSCKQLDNERAKNPLSTFALLHPHRNTCFRIQWRWGEVAARYSALTGAIVYIVSFDYVHNSQTNCGMCVCVSGCGVLVKKNYHGSSHGSTPSRVERCCLDVFELAPICDDLVPTGLPFSRRSMRSSILCPYGVLCRTDFRWSLIYTTSLVFANAMLD